MGLVEIQVNEEFIKRMNEYRKKPEGKGLLLACSESVVLFSEYMLGLKLYAWQVYFLVMLQKALEDGSLPREYLALTSRQIGKSTAVSVFALWACTFNKKPGTLHNNTVVGVISATDVQAKKLLNEIKKLIKAGDKFMEITYLDPDGNPKFGKKFFTSLLDDKEANNTTTVTFKQHTKNFGELLLFGSNSGSVIKSYPPTDSVLGETFTIVVEDEAGKSDKISDQFHYEYVYPTGNSTNAVRVYTSTPWVTSGFFYRLADPSNEYQDHPAERVMFTIDAIKIENPEYYENVKTKVIDVMNRDGKTDEVQRAYYCRFVKGELAYFDNQRVAKIFSNRYQMLNTFKEPCDMGIDFGGQVISRTVITITAFNEEKKQITRLFHKVYDVGKDLSLLSDVEELMKRFNIQRIIPDDCPAGWHLIEQMKLKGWDVNPMNFRTDKVKKYGAFRASLNRGEIESYEDADLRTEMLALEFSQGSKQSVIQHAPGYTDDLIDSFVMSCYFFVQEDGGFKYYDMSDDEDY